MNKVQRDYIKAMAMLDAIEAEEREFEENYCKNKGYKFKTIFRIEDEAGFDEANKELAELEQKMDYGRGFALQGMQKWKLRKD